MQRYMSGFCKLTRTSISGTETRHIVYSNRDRLGFYVKIQIIFMTMKYSMPISRFHDRFDFLNSRSERLEEFVCLFLLYMKTTSGNPSFTK